MASTIRNDPFELFHVLHAAFLCGPLGRKNTTRDTKKAGHKLCLGVGRKIANDHKVAAILLLAHGDGFVVEESVGRDIVVAGIFTQLGQHLHSSGGGGRYRGELNDIYVRSEIIYIK